MISASSGQLQPQGQAPPQTARQALLEMFIKPKPGDLEKHLPDLTLKLLAGGKQAPNSEILQQFVNFSAGLTANQKSFESFDSGPILFSMEPAPGGKKIEVMVERDDLVGEADEIELSLHLYANGRQEALPIVPRFTFAMKQENDVWKLHEMAVTLRVPLGDADYLKGLQSLQNKALERAATGNLIFIQMAEAAYAKQFPERGYTCKLADLAGEASGKTTGAAKLIESDLAQGEKGGYVFAIAGCQPNPSSTYQVSAVPADKDSNLRAFCSDESGHVRYATDGKAATCLSQGSALDPAADPEF